VSSGDFDHAHHAFAATRRGEPREDHADGGSHRQHHHQGQDGADHREGRQLAAAAAASLRVSRRIFPFIQRVFADSGYAGEKLTTATLIAVEIVLKSFASRSSPVGLPVLHDFRNRS
jgi:hypothetical protein